jgi:hypothetical protein
MQAEQVEAENERVSFYAFSSHHLDTASYESLETKFTPLDLIFFKGGDWPSKFIQYLEEKIVGDGMFSHVGILVSKDLLPGVKGLEEGEWYVWESTMSIYIPYFQEDDVVNIETGKGKLGVQIRKLKDVVASYTKLESPAGDSHSPESSPLSGPSSSDPSVKEETFVAWAPLKDNPWKNPLLRSFIIDKIAEVHRDTKDLSYEKNMFELGGSILSLLRPLIKLLKKIKPSRRKSKTKEKLPRHKKSSGRKKSKRASLDSLGSHDVDDSYFCSELVAYIYKELGILAATITPEWVVPMDFLGYDRDGEIPNCVEYFPIKILPPSE